MGIFISWQIAVTLIKKQRDSTVFFRLVLRDTMGKKFMTILLVRNYKAVNNRINFFDKEWISHDEYGPSLPFASCTWCCNRQFNNPAFYRLKKMLALLYGNKQSLNLTSKTNPCLKTI